MTEIVIPDHLEVLGFEQDELPFGWDNAVPIAATQELGKRWVEDRRFAVLSVPSSIVRRERNFVMNRTHPAFEEITFLPSSPFRFDPRLK